MPRTMAGCSTKPGSSLGVDFACYIGHSSISNCRIAGDGGGVKRAALREGKRTIGEQAVG
jgi:hypothetical protein